MHTFRFGYQSMHSSVHSIFFLFISIPFWPRERQNEEGRENNSTHLRFVSFFSYIVCSLLMLHKSKTRIVWLLIGQFHMHVVQWIKRGIRSAATASSSTEKNNKSFKNSLIIFHIYKFLYEIISSSFEYGCRRFSSLSRPKDRNGITHLIIGFEFTKISYPLIQFCPSELMHWRWIKSIFTIWEFEINTYYKPKCLCIIFISRFFFSIFFLRHHNMLSQHLESISIFFTYWIRRLWIIKSRPYYSIDFNENIILFLPVLFF